MSGLNLSLALQLINVWDFTPLNDDVKILINDNSYPFLKKTGGYRIITKELPEAFKLTVLSSNFFPYIRETDNLPKNKILPIQLIPLYPKGKPKAAWLKIDAPLENVKIVLGLDFFTLSAAPYQNTISVKNLNRTNLEGRFFLIRDLKTLKEEFLTIEDGKNVLFTEYNIPYLENSYTVNSVLLPAFDVSGVAGKIPLRIPQNFKYPIWIYSPDAEKYEIVPEIEINI